jgi:hypothetical protein
MSSAVGNGISGKETSGVDKAKLRKKRLQSLDKGKTKSLGLIEKWTMQYVGWVDVLSWHRNL